MQITAELVKTLREKTGAGILDCKKALTENNGDIEKSIEWLREKGITKASKKSDRVAAEGLTSTFFEGNKAVIYEVNSETDFVAKNQLFLDLLDKLDKELIKLDFSSDEELLKLTIDGQSVETILLNATAVIGEKISLRRAQIVTKKDNEVFAFYKHQGGKITALVVAEGNEEAARNIAMHVAAINPQYITEKEISEEVVAKEKDILIKTAIEENKQSAKPKPENIVEKMVEGRLQKYLKEICLVHQQYVKSPDQTVSQYLTSEKTSISKFVRLEVGEGIEKVETNFQEEVMQQLKK